MSITAETAKAQQMTLPYYVVEQRAESQLNLQT